MLASHKGAVGPLHRTRACHERGPCGRHRRGPHPRGGTCRGWRPPGSQGGPVGEGGPLGSARQLASALAERSMAECEVQAASQDGNWSETGDRYLLKLFRDFVFHQTAPSGHEAEGGPLMDWGHVIESLNKLDAGALERIMLLTRDESSMLVASYGDLKRCVESSYADLQGQAAAAAARNRAMGASL
ncbi:hypothetical protein DUNSADRAFT_12545 [Dunaliella salina]|uniref:Pan3 C-terminal knob domain-containing protein n=1 Tax=Dunaliella salina TaxID=3046 RepID=A0ABQ7GB51_DUNSA|nr:hypothetical protein DUNSADRAFT_12545 [Dunaliella salina]|eukprot:KAF5831831.1 hypothetical protein DUNSADRAFT_12545 [Dunaliella salina]